MEIKFWVDDRPIRSELHSWAELLDLTGISPGRASELIELGWVSPVVTSHGDYLFRHRDVYRIQKFERLRQDFELSIVGGTIVVDLLDRIDQLETKIRELEQRLRG